jgi:hypothetical protein
VCLVGFHCVVVCDKGYTSYRYTIKPLKSISHITCDAHDLFFVSIDGDSLVYHRLPSHSVHHSVK